MMATQYAAQAAAFAAGAARQDAAFAVEAPRPDAARAAQAERERMLASFNSLAAAAEQRFASRRSNYFEARSSVANNNELWARYNTAFVYCDRVLGQILNWRTSAIMEVGSTPESALIVRLLAIENDAMSVLQYAPPIVAPGLLMAPVVPAPVVPAPLLLGPINHRIQQVDVEMKDADDDDQPD